VINDAPYTQEEFDQAYALALEQSLNGTVRIEDVDAELRYLSQEEDDALTVAAMRELGYDA
jgi:hypothetical protein